MAGWDGGHGASLLCLCWVNPNTNLGHKGKGKGNKDTVEIAVKLINRLFSNENEIPADWHMSLAFKSFAGGKHDDTHWEWGKRKAILNPYGVQYSQLWDWRLGGLQ